MNTTEFIAEPELRAPPPPLGAAFKDVVTAATILLKNEAHLAQTEASEAMAAANKLGQRMLLSYVLAVLGVVPLMAFFVLALGDLLDGRYTLSSLIVAAVFSGSGALVYFYSRLELQEKTKLSATRKSVEAAADSVQHKFEQLKQTIGGSHGIRTTYSQ